MKKLILLCSLTLILGACSDSEKKKQECKNSERTCLFNVSPIIPEAEGALPNEAYTFDTNLTLVNFSLNQQDKILKAAELIREVVASEEFRDAVFNHTYDGEKTFVENGGLSNAQIYQRFLEGAEWLSPRKNNQLDAIVELYYEDSTTIGYTKPDSRKIWMNTKYFNKYNAAQVAGNLTHEWVHKLGFAHSSAYTNYRRYSVPYAMGYLMERLAKKRL